MAYLGDIREKSISPEGIIWENDNRKDARYYWNGAFIDLCDLPGEDYAKTIFVTSGGSGNESTTKTSNPISVQQVTYFNEEGIEVYAYKATSKMPVTSNVVVEMTVADETGAEEIIKITLVSGTSSSEIFPTSMMVTMAPPKVITSDYNPKEDDKYEYDAILPEETIKLPMGYQLTLLSKEIDVITDDELIKLLNENSSINMETAAKSKKFMVNFKKIAVDGLSDMSVIEMTDALINNAQDIIIVTDSSIKAIEQADVAGINEISLWVKTDRNIVLDGKKFDIWYKRDEGQTSQSCVYDPLTNEVVGTENREYIIFYE